MASTGTPPFRAEHVGSLLRPRALKEAFGKFGRGEIDRAELEIPTEDAAETDTDPETDTEPDTTEDDA